MPLLDGRRALIFGVANRRSIAWAIAQALAREGADLAFTFQGERIEQGVRDLAATVNSPLVVPADVTSDADLDRVSAADILKLLDRLNVELGKTIAMVTHDPRAAEAAHHLIYLDKGQLTDTSPFTG